MLYSEGTLSRSNRNLENFFFRRGVNQGTQRKTSRSKDDNQQQTQSTYTKVGGESSRHPFSPMRNITLMILFIGAHACTTILFWKVETCACKWLLNQLHVISLITYSSIDAVDALPLHTCAFHQRQFVEVNFWFFWWRSIL